MSGTISQIKHVNFLGAVNTAKMVVRAIPGPAQGGGLTNPVQYIQYDTTPSIDIGVGIRSWNELKKTTQLQMDGSVILLDGEETFYPISVNKSGVTIDDGDAVMFTGAQGDKLTIAKADTSAVSPRYMMGVATETILDNQEGRVTWFGEVNDINTNAWTIGTELFVDPDNVGGLTSTEPTAPDPIISMAVVTRQGTTNGSIMVRPWFGSFLDELHDVEISSLIDKDFLEYDSTSETWMNRARSTPQRYVMAGAKDEEYTITYAATVAIDFDDGNEQFVNATGNLEITAFDNFLNGGKLEFNLFHVGGVRTLTLPEVVDNKETITLGGTSGGWDTIMFRKTNNILSGFLVGSI
jgi:hypothetical protein